MNKKSKSGAIAEFSFAPHVGTNGEVVRMGVYCSLLEKKLVVDLYNGKDIGICPNATPRNGHYFCKKSKNVDGSCMVEPILNPLAESYSNFYRQYQRLSQRMRELNYLLESQSDHPKKDNLLQRILRKMPFFKEQS